MVSTGHKKAGGHWQSITPLVGKGRQHGRRGDKQKNIQGRYAAVKGGIFTDLHDTVVSDTVTHSKPHRAFMKFARM